MAVAARATCRAAVRVRGHLIHRQLMFLLAALRPRRVLAAGAHQETVGKYLPRPAEEQCRIRRRYAHVNASHRVNQFCNSAERIEANRDAVVDHLPLDRTIHKGFARCFMRANAVRSGNARLHAFQMQIGRDFFRSD